MDINGFLPRLRVAVLEVWLPAQLLILQRYCPSFNFCTWGILSTAVWDPSTSQTSHSSLPPSSPAGFHCHWQLRGSVPVVVIVKFTGVPGTISLKSCGWLVILGGSATDGNITVIICTRKEIKKNSYQHQV